MRFQKILFVCFSFFAAILFASPAFAASDLDSGDYEYPAKNCRSCGAALEVDLERSNSPNCVKVGAVFYVRCACGTRNAGAQIPALGHLPGRTVYTGPSCKFPGIITTFCARCDEYMYAEEVGEPAGHTWERNPDDSGREPTCTESGSMPMVCTVCRDTKFEDIPALGGEHVWEQVRVYYPSCTLFGGIVFECSRCGSGKRESLDSLGHDWTETSRTPATCTDPGSIGYNCSRCSETKSTVLPALAEDHTWVETSRTNPSCTTTGLIAYDCSVCQSKKSDTLPALGHSWTETSRTDATCTAAGSVSYACSVCEETKTESLSALGHAWEETNRTPATCTTPGSVDRTCTRCGFTASEELPALGSDHTWSETSRREPTQTAPGLVEYTCSVCGSVKSETLPALSSSGSMSELLAVVSSILSVALGWMSVVANKVASNPILLLAVVIGFLGTGVILFKRFLNM